MLFPFLLKVLILDEPCAGLDPENRRIMWDVLLKWRNNCTLFMSTHDMEEADILGDRIVIMAKGTVRCSGSPSFLKKALGKTHCFTISHI